MISLQEAIKSTIRITGIRTSFLICFNVEIIFFIAEIFIVINSGLYQK